MKNRLIGKTIKDIKIAKDKMALKFIFCDDTDLVVKADAECCSHSWIESVDILAVLPANVISVDDLELNSNLNTRDGELSFYGCKISTDKGDIVIDYRNESNGYYGGSLSWPDDNGFYGGVYGQNISKEEWVDIN